VPRVTPNCSCTPTAPITSAGDIRPATSAW
jgi:hypothetical protein